MARKITVEVSNFGESVGKKKLKWGKEVTVMALVGFNLGHGAKGENVSENLKGLHA